MNYKQLTKEKKAQIDILLDFIINYLKMKGSMLS